MPRLPVSLHASLRSLRLSSPTASAAAHRLPSRRPYSSSPLEDEPESIESASEIESVEPAAPKEPFSAPFHLPHQYSRVQRPNIIEGKVPRTTFDGAVPKTGVFTPENAHLSVRPLSVRQREAYDIDLLKPGEEPRILRTKELQRWWRARAAGELATNPETVEEIRQSQMDWRADLDLQRRSQVRGLVDGKIVGQRIYLPNIVFRMIPNATGFIRPKQDRKANVHANQRNKPLAMEQYNPYIATFRVPAALNKMDIKGYLKAVYNLDTTFVATAIMHKTRYKADNGRGRWMNGKSKDNYKRAVVGLTKPFYYPNDPLGMEPEARMEYEEKLNTNFKTQLYRDAEVTMRRRQYNNVRNNIGLSERSAKIYQTTPDLSLKKSKPAQLAEKDRVRKELADAVLREREAEARGEKSGKEDKEADATEKTIPEGEIVEEEDWRSRR